MDEDLKLVSEVLNGNMDSFNIMVNKYGIPVLRFIYNMVKNKEAAEDISQEVFITVYNKLYTYKNSYKFSSWLFQIARNKSIDYIRKYRRVYESNIEDILNVESRDESPEQTAEYRETKKMIEKFINSLDEYDRQILILKYSSKDMTFPDISQILNMNESSVKRRYYRARDEFKNQMSVRERGVHNGL